LPPSRENYHQSYSLSIYSRGNRILRRA
jgi:hypothetical protein